MCIYSHKRCAYEIYLSYLISCISDAYPSFVVSDVFLMQILVLLYLMESIHLFREASRPTWRGVWGVEPPQTKKEKQRLLAAAEVPMSTSGSTIESAIMSGGDTGGDTRIRAVWGDSWGTISVIPQLRSAARNTSLEKYGKYTCSAPAKNTFAFGELKSRYFPEVQNETCS